MHVHACADSVHVTDAGRHTICQPRRPSAASSQAAEADLLRISNKVRFILAVVSGALKISNRRKADIEAELEQEGYDRLASQKKAAAAQVRDSRRVLAAAAAAGGAVQREREQLGRAQVAPGTWSHTPFATAWCTDLLRRVRPKRTRRARRALPPPRTPRTTTCCPCR